MGQETQIRNVSIERNRTKIIEIRWIPSEVGKYTITASVDQAEGEHLFPKYKYSLHGVTVTSTSISGRQFGSYDTDNDHSPQNTGSIEIRDVKSTPAHPEVGEIVTFDVTLCNKMLTLITWKCCW